MAVRQPPGALPADAQPDVVMMLCTAGHVDHGKTALVKLLTGCMTDRLRVEQERGLTIELGFAPCFLGDDMAVGIVDVPGHEKFVRNMVAGVSGIGMTLLVIAADDGIMPQTVEHFQIMDLLGVRRGMVALTKTDLVDAATVEQRKMEIGTWLADTWMQDAPICPVSSETFEGYDAFYATLVEQIGLATKGQRRGIFRLPVERTFRQEGFGSVVTGIPLAGVVRLVDELELVPGGRTGRVRGLQRFGKDAEEGAAGQCLAINIPDLGKEPPERGQVLCAPGYLRPAWHVHVDLHAIAGLEHPLRNAEAVKFHTGTAEMAGKIYLLEEKQLAGGGRMVATVAFDEPVACAPHDRFIIRRASPALTVAGGGILALTYENKRPRRARILPKLENLRSLFEGVDLTTDDGVDRRVLGALRWEAPLGASLREIARLAFLEQETARAGLERLGERGYSIPLGTEVYIHVDRLREIRERAEACIAQAEASGTLKLTAGELRQGEPWPTPLYERIAGDLEAAGRLQRDGDRIVLRGAVDDMPPAEREAMEKIESLYSRTGWKSPRPEEVPEKLGISPGLARKMLQHLYDERRVVRLDKNVAVHYDVYRKAQDLAVHTIQEQGNLDAGGFKSLIGTSRKYAVAFLDHLDAHRITLRVGNDRKLMRGYEKNLW